MAEWLGEQVEYKKSILHRLEDIEQAVGYTSLEFRGKASTGIISIQRYTGDIRRRLACPNENSKESFMEEV